MYPLKLESSSKRRNLIVCIDGSSNQFGTKVHPFLTSFFFLVLKHYGLCQNTNVIELYKCIPGNDEQFTYYSSGVGTYAKGSWWTPGAFMQWADSKIDVVIAW